MVDVQVGTELVELVLACRGTLAQAEEPVGELLSVVRKDRANAHWTSSLQVSQKAPSIRRSLCLEAAVFGPRRLGLQVT